MTDINDAKNRKARVATYSKNPDAGKDAADPYSPLCANVLDVEQDSFCVYAGHREVQTPEKKPQLEDINLKYPFGNDSESPGTLKKGNKRIGQAGWHIGIDFNCLTELEAKLREAKISHGQITRLAIATHGQYGGLWFPNGSGVRYNKKFPPYMTKVWQRDGVPEFDDVIGSVRRVLPLTRSAATNYGDPTKTSEVESYVFSVEDYQPLLSKIGLYVRHCGTIILMGCVMGQGPEGTALLKELARIWPHRKVVAFTTIGIVDKCWMESRGRYLAGMKDSGYRDYAPLSTHYDELVERLPTLQWASEFSPTAKVVMSHGKDGDGNEMFEILKHPVSEHPVNAVAPKPAASSQPPEPVKKKKGSR